MDQDPSWNNRRLITAITVENGIIMPHMRNLGFLLCASMSSAVILTSAGAPAGSKTQMAGINPLPIASVYFEQNATDGDVEVVFKAKGGDDGLAHFKVVSPDGRTVINFKAPDKSTMGIRQFHLESPEPKDVGALKTAYPEGEYQFSARTFSGAVMTAASTLSHRLPTTAQFVTPTPKAADVPTTNVMVSWRTVAGAERYIVKIEQDELGTKIETTLTANSTSFDVPNGFLSPGTEYELAIGTVSAAGNISFVETSFTTRK